MTVLKFVYAFISQVSFKKDYLDAEQKLLGPIVL